MVLREIGLIQGVESCLVCGDTFSEGIQASIYSFKFSVDILS